MKFKLTSSQMNFYNKNFTLDSQIWNQGVMQVFPKVYSYEEINNAYNKLVETHDSLRVKLVETEDGVVADVREHEYINYRFWQVKTEEELMQKAQEFLNEPTDRYGLLVDCAVFNTSTTSGIMINAHHIVVDGYSVIVMAEHINELLKNINFTPIIQKYSDYIEAEEKHKQSRRFDKAKDFWLKEFSNNPECEIFTAKGNILDFYSDEVNSVISNDLFCRVEKFCEENEISVTSFFNTIYGIYFSRMCETSSFTMGVPVLNRTTQSEFNTIGLYMHVLPMVCNIVEETSFLHNAQFIEDTQMNLLRHQKFTQTDIKEALKTIGHESNNLFSVATDYQSFTTKNEYEAIIKYANYLATPLEIHLQSFNNTHHKFKIRYRTSYFNRQEVEIMLKSIVALMENAVESPFENISTLKMVSENEEEKLLKAFNDTTVEYPRDKCVLTLLEETVKANPYAKAVVAQDKSLTYGELDNESNKLANSLIEKGVGKGDIVGIKLGRTSKFLVSLLGILKTGAAYLPLDPDHPQDRIKTILEDSSAKLCITEENFDELTYNSNTEKPDIKISGDDLCYCIYTSGSTGTPKGAMIQHKNVCWYMHALMSIYGTDPINMPFFTSTSVDLSVPSYLLPLVTGGTTYFYDNDLLVDLADIVNNEEINTIKVTPTHLQIMLQHIEGRTLHNMKYLISGGESLRQADCVKFLEKFGEHIEIHNEYGPTEATVSCVDYLFSRDDTDHIVSIGTPIDNVQIYIVDKYMNLLPLGVTGELCIAGDGVCAGYLNNPELTEEKFVNNPFGEGKLYKTGDLAFWREDGRLTFVGRNDFQVKIRGLRIEIGEIENAVLNVDGVVQCAVVVRTDANDRQFICAFYTGAETKAIDFRTILGTKLPKYMIPHIFTRLDEMPLTSSGKISRNSLPEIDLESISTETEYVSPKTDEEKALVNAIKAVLNVEEVSLLDSFFNIGGDSITAIYLVSDLEDSGYGLNVADIMQSDTLQEIAKSIRTKTKTEAVDEHKDNPSATGDYDQNEVTGIVPYSPIMRAFLEKSNGVILNDFVHTCIISVDCNEETIRKALDILVSHHDILRGTFVENGIEILPSDEYKAYSFASINIADRDEAIKRLRKTKLDDKLVKAVFCYTKEDCLLSITVHHFLIDLVSWEVLMKDFNTIVKKLNDNEKALLPDKTASFKLWNEELATYSDTMPEENKAYWDSINEELAKSKSFKTSEEINEAEEYHFTLSSEITGKLINKVNKTYNTRLNEVLLTALGLAAGKLAEGSVGIIVESHGRAELHKPIAIEKTIGWFTSCYPVVIKNNENIAEELVRVKETMRSIPKNGVEYLLLNNGFHNNANIKFNYYKNSISNETRDNKLVEFNGSSSVFPDMINVGCSVTEDILSVLITVPECMHKKDISKELGKEFIKQIEKVIEYADVLPATAAQMRIYTAHFTSDEPTLYNLSSAFKMENFDAERFENAVNQLIARHEGLRTSFENRNGQVFQIINDTASIKIEKLDSPNLSDFIRPFDLTKAPLMRVGYIDNTVIVDFHHIISDGSTFGIFYEEINELYMGRELPEAVQYREFAVNDTYTKEDEEYWLNEFEEIPDFELYTDFPEQEAKSDKGINLYTKIDQNLHENILIKCKEWGVTPYAYYMGCVSVLLSKYSGSEDVCVGVTSNGRDSKFLNTWGMFVNMLSIRTKPESEKTFKDFVNEIKNKSFNAIAHQSYPQQELLKKLNIRKPLYDVMFIYQSEKMTHSVIGDKKAELIPVTISTSRAPIMFYIHPREEDTLLRTEYLTDLFKAETIDKLIASYMGILTQALDEKALIKDITVLSDVEKEKLLNDFNNTDHKYDVPDNSTLYSLFEKASEENSDKVCIKANNQSITFADFKNYAERIDSKVRNITDNSKSVVAVICERSFEMYGAIYGIIRGGNAYLPIDPNYPQERIDYILSNSNAKAVITQDKFCHLAGNVPCINATDVLNNKETIKETEILANENDTAYVIYTSGSTGNPKGAKISHKSAINRILWMHDFYPLNENDVILQKTPYTFDVSVWELFWWGIKGRTLCASKPDEHFLPAKILEETNNHKVTHLHFVPSVFDIFLTYLENNPDEQYKFNSVKYVFLSGEALTANSINRFYNIYDYNKVTLHNLYGPTECAVDVSYYDCVPTDIDPVPIGKPIYNTQLHIIDKYLNPTPIGVTGELCIAGVNVGQGYLNNEQLTNEKFIPNPFGEGRLYKTGDLAYWREDGQICYVGRMDNQIKLNGQRIELGEIENAIGEIDGVVQCAVIVRKDNEDTQHLCAFYTGKELDTKELRTILNTKLPRYMVPHSFTHLETMPLTSSGKINRNALPEIDLNNLSTETEFVAPTTEKEKTLTKAIASVLNIEKVSILDNFFDIGGDSLKSIELVSKIEDKGYTVNVKSIFEAKDIQNLAKELITKTEAKEKVEYSSVLPATAAQMRIYTAQMMKSDSTHYNVNYAFKVKEVNKEKLQKAINDLIARHESLRTHFENINGVVNQVIDESATVIVDELTTNLNDFIKPFDLSHSPLLRIGCNEETVVIDLHHIIVDGESMPVFFKELNELYMGRELNDTVQYGEFAVTDTYTEENEKYWLNVFSEEINTLELPTDYQRPETQSFNGANTFTIIDNQLNESIQNKCKQLGLTSYAYYMACYNILLSKYSGNEDICVGTPMSGRTSKFLNTIGMFVNTVALRNNPTGTKTFIDFVNEVKENSINAIDNQNYPFNELVKKLNLPANNRNPLFDVVFAYQGEEMTNILLGDKKGEIIPVNTKSVKNELAFYLFPRKEDVVLTVSYCTDLFKEETITKFIEAYNSILAQCLNSDILIKDISVLTEEEKERILNKFNDTKADYPRDKCIHKLFEEQVERTPDKIALVAVDNKLTYRELNEEANKFAHSLIEKGVGKGDIVGIKLGRTSKFLVSLLGILKTGAAYLPFDTAHPQNRIEQILSDSNAKLCITEENFNELLNNSNTENPDTNISGDSLCYCIYTSGSTGTPKGAMIQHKNLNWYMCALTSIYGTEPINMPFFTSPSVDLSVPSYFLPLVTGGTTYFYDNELLKDLTDIFNNEEINTIKVTPTHLQIILQHIEAKTLHNMKYLISGGESLYHSSCVEFLEKFGKHIEIHNEYGPTETTVSCVDYVFSCVDTDDIVSIGNPINNAKIYIVDKHNNLLPIGVTGELCIAGDGVCAGYLNNETLTNEKFIDNPFGEGKLYKTGDLAFWKPDGNLAFVGRNDFQVKIRGLRIELGEIENAIVNIDGVVQCAVVVRKDKNDRQLICAFYTGAETDARDFRTILGTRLPKYMIPHAFVCLDEMPLTSSGKVNRNALPEIDLESISTDTEYVAPTTKEEEILVAAIEKVLDIEKASVLDSFFNVGGDSITAIYLVSELEDSDYELSVSDIMQSDTLQELASKIKTKKETIDEQKDNLSATINYEQNEVNGFIPFTPIMRAFLKNSNGTISKDYVHTGVLSVDCNEETVKKALDILVSHHDILRGTFVENGIEILSSDEYKAYSFASINIADKDEAIKQLRNTKLDDKFVKAVFCYTKEDCLLSITVHHFLIDLVSWEVLMKDFTTIVKQLCNNEEVCLSAKTASFKYWNVALQEYSKVIPEENKEYWTSINNQLDNTKAFSENECENEAEKYSFTFSKEISQKLISKVNKTYKTRTNEVLLTALGLAAGQISRNPVGIIVESHGRAELHKPIATEKTVGWFTTCYPVVINNNNSVTTELVNVKDAMRGIPKNGVEYLLLNNGFHNNANIKFNYYKNSISNENRENKLVAFNGSSSVFPNMINVSCSVADNILSMFITVPICKHKKGISEELGKEFIKQIEKIIESADVLPATAAQMRIYTAQAMSSEPTLYNLSSAFKMENLDIERFEDAINKLIARHESLRTSFENRNGQIFQIIHETASIKLEKLESSDLSAFTKPFDLTKAPLMRVGYIDDTVIIGMHHIISDGTTFGLFYKEINELYMGRELPEAVQYREFAVSDTYTKEDEEYWLKEFEELPDFELYTDFPNHDAKSDKGRNLYTQIDRSLYENILARCKEWGVTPYAYYMACISILLSKYSGIEDVCIGVTSNGRSSKFLNTFGMFVNMLSIRTKPEYEKSFKDFVAEIKDKSFNAITHQSYPQQELLKKLNIKKPLYDVMFIYLSGKDTQAIGRDKKAESIPLTISTSRAPLMFYVHPRENDALLRIEYLTDLFKPETIDKLIASYMDILAQALNEEVIIKNLSVIAEDEKNTILNTFNNTEYTYNIPENSTLYSLFEKASEENKNKVCIKANDSEITFKDFKAYAERIDNKVREITNNEKSVIAVICERSFEMYGAIYGIIRGGNAYLPIDPNYPQERIDYILSNSNAKAVITQDKFCHLAGNVPCINATDVLNNKETIKETEILANENDTAYVIYTSGSTGNPKGAKISHKSAINRILWMHNFYPLEDNDVILQKTPYTFDVSVWELFWWGITGRTLCASKPDEHFLPAKILQETEKNKVTHLHFVPSVFELFLTYLENNPDEQYKFNSVKYVFLSGEALTANSINRFYNIYDYNKVTLHNLYGPTECAVDVSYYDCVPTDIDPVPIGKPIYNTQLHIIDKYLNPTPIGVTGELCIAGVNVGQGYLNNEQLTNEKFIPNPFGEGRLYKTGDLAYWREDGQICYVGRMDNQIKLNGQRIELGEIEKVISEVSGIESVAIIIKENNGQDVLVAFCCGNESSTNEILKHCENKLPHYMVPSKFQFIEKMPLNQSGKLDRKALKNIDVVFDNTSIKEAPVTETEKLICVLFKDILGVESVGRNENFFALGGTSLDMIAILSENELKNISAADFIANPTPEKLAKFIDESNIPDSDGFYTLRNVPTSTKALILFPYAGGDASAFAALTKDLSVIVPELSLYYVDYLHSYAECEKVAEKIAVLAKSKEINIYSHCAGTAVAMQIINILEKQGIVISNYITAGFIPSEKPHKRNGWNYTFKRSIQHKLIKAGAPIEKFSTEYKYEMVEKFRKDTDFLTEYFYTLAQPIKAKTSVIISKTDIFTKNHMDAERLWKIRSSNFNKVYYIDADSHYFQTENSDTVARIITDILSE